MANYIDRTPNVETVALVNDAVTVTMRTRVVGTTAIVDVTEESPVNARPASKTVLVGLVRGEARRHVAKPRAVGVPIADTEFVRHSHHLADNGHAVIGGTRVRVATFVVASR